MITNPFDRTAVSALYELRRSKQQLTFSRDEIADLISALQSAQQELAYGPGLPEGSAQWERWEQLLARFRTIIT